MEIPCQSPIHRRIYLNDADSGDCRIRRERNLRPRIADYKEPNTGEIRNVGRMLAMWRQTGNLFSDRWHDLYDALAHHYLNRCWWRICINEFAIVACVLDFDTNCDLDKRNLCQSLYQFEKKFSRPDDRVLQLDQQNWRGRSRLIKRLDRWPLLDSILQRAHRESVSYCRRRPKWTDVLGWRLTQSNFSALHRNPEVLRIISQS